MTSTYYRLWIIEKPFTKLEESVWHCLIHDRDARGEKMLMNKRVYNYLKEFLMEREDCKPTDHPKIDARFIRTMTTAYLKPGMEIPDFCEVLDKTQFDLEWDFNENPFYWPFRRVWHDSFDIGEDYHETPPDARVVGHAINVNGRKITTGFIMDVQIAGASKEIVNFLEDHRGKYAVLIN